MDFYYLAIKVFSLYLPVEPGLESIFISRVHLPLSHDGNLYRLFPIIKYLISYKLSPLCCYELPASTIKKIRNHNDPNPTLTTLLAIANYFTITLSQLVGDESLPKDRIKGLYTTPLQGLFSLPLISWEEALTWPAIDPIAHDTITTEYEFSKEAYALTVLEEDWENIAKGTVLLVDPTLEAEHRDFVIVYKRGQKIPNLRQLLIDDGEKYLKSTILGYTVLPMTLEHKILGVVAEYKKSLKKSSIY